jgi:hypothetical protein
MFGLVLVAAVVCVEGLPGCSSGGGAGGAPDGGGQDATGEAASSSSGSSSGATSSSSGGSSSGGSSSGEAGSTGSSSGGPGDGGTDAGDGFEASRTACITTINALRAASDAGTLLPYTLKDDDTTDTCVDTQATNDQSHNTAHYSFENDAPSCIWGDAASAYQNECTGAYGTTPAAVEQCIKDMWSEGTRPDCAGCVGCTAPAGGCANCDYYGTKGYPCGDYVNLSSPLITTVACGFGGSQPSSSTGWSVLNFE